MCLPSLSFTTPLRRSLRLSVFPRVFDQQRREAETEPVSWRGREVEERGMKSKEVEG